MVRLITLHFTTMMIRAHTGGIRTPQTLGVRYLCGRFLVRVFSSLGVTIHSTSDLDPIQELHIPGHESPWHLEEEIEEENESSSEEQTHPCNEPEEENCDD